MHPTTFDSKLHHQHYTEDTGTPLTVDLFLVNIQGLITQRRNKSHFLKTVTSTNNSSQIIAVTETWAQAHFNGEYTQAFDGYNIIRADRDYNFNPDDDDQLVTRGGCLLLTTPNITITPIVSYSNGNCEILIADLPTIHTTAITIYRPSGINFSLKHFSAILGKARTYLTTRQVSGNEGTILLTGDFNFNSAVVNWEKSDHGLLPNFTEGASDQYRGFQLLLDLVEEFALEQMVDKPTRKKEVLDLIFTNKPCLMSECKTTIIHPVSDHNLVYITISSENIIGAGKDDPNTKYTIREISKYNFQGANLQTLEQRFSTFDWHSIINEETDPETFNQVFVDTLIQIADLSNVQRYKNTVGKGVKETKETFRILKLHREREKLHKLLLLPTSRHNDNKRFTDRIEEVNKELEQIHAAVIEQNEATVIAEINTNVKAFYTYANKFRRTRSKIGALKSGETYESGERAMAEILSKQYASVFSQPQPSTSYNLPQVTPHTIEDIEITSEDIQEAMESIKVSSAPGPDGIPAFLYQRFAAQLTHPVMTIWRLSLDTGKMPEGKILAIITPIPKEGDKGDPANYRPISLTNHLTKVFERVLRKHLVIHLETQPLMNTTQHGFRGGRSTISQLLCYYDSILSMLEDGLCVDAVYLDFAKAFDTVDHNILLQKVEALGIRAKLCLPGSGVPQGSVLAPLLFIIMMIDIDAAVKDVFLGSFADDTRIWQATWQNVIQAELNHMYEWAEKNNMQYNSKKFERLRYGQSTDKIKFISPQGAVITDKENVKDLGIYMYLHS